MKLSSLFEGDRKQVFIAVFYSIWASIILLLLNITSQTLGCHFLTRSLFFNNDFHIIRSAITIAYIFALIQIYLPLVRKRAFSTLGYWVLLALLSALPMYLKYKNDFVNLVYLSLNNIQFYMSFICRLIPLIFGVTYKTWFNFSNVESINLP
jgi:hypothetical protein